MSKIYIPREYQKTGSRFLHNIDRGALWAGMGMGKTVTMLTHIWEEAMLGENRPALVLAPWLVAAQTWPDEAKKWSHLASMDIQPVIGNAKERERALLNSNAKVFTVNYENIPWLVEHLNGKWPFYRVASDESTKLKSLRASMQTSKTGKQFLRISGGKRAGALVPSAHRTDKWTNMTGTPLPNGLQDLWGQTYLLDYGARLGRNFTAFSNRWFAPDHSGYGLKPHDFAFDEIMDRLKDICLTLDPKDYFDLKDPIVDVREFDLPSKVRDLYNSLERDMFMELDDGTEIEAVNAGAKSIKCLQVASGAIYTDDDKNWQELHDYKLQILQSIVNEWNGAPILVAYHWKHDLARLMKAFPQGRHLDKNPQTVRDWCAGKIPLLFAHPASVGHGLNLQDGGNIIVYFSHWWDAEAHDQILERIGSVRQMQSGYDRPVWVYYICARKTVDKMCISRVKDKRDLQSIFMDGMKGIY